jgi:hypothetical protein
MTDLMPTALRARETVRDREGMLMLIHEALARSRQREAEEAARQYRLVRSLTAGRYWAWLAGFAARRATRARAGAPSNERGVCRASARGAL